MNYLGYWRLYRRPFLFPPGTDFFAGTPQREVLAGINDFIASDARIAFLCSPPTNGLSWLFTHLESMRGLGDRAVEIVVTGRGSSSRSSLAAALGDVHDGADLHRVIDRSLRVLHRQGVQLVWLLDRPQAGHPADVAALARSHENLSVVMGGPSAGWRFPVPSGQRHTLAPLSMEDALRYVRYCMERAGGDPSSFPERAAIRLFQWSGGRVGRLAWAAEAALALTAHLGQRRVTTAIAESAVHRWRPAA